MRYHTNLFFNIIIFILILGIMACNDSSKRVQHPDKSNLIKDVDLSFIIKKHDVRRSLFEDIKKSWTISDFNINNTQSPIGEISDAFISNSQNIYLVDKINNKLIVMNSEGKVTSVFGQKGEGPNEFHSFNKLAVSSDEKNLYALDTFGKLKIFAQSMLEGKASFSYRTMVVFPFPVNDICSINDKIYIHGTNHVNQSFQKGSIHVFSYDGKYIKSFGYLYKSKNWLAVMHMSSGIMSCNKELNTVSISLQNTPYVYGYDSETGAEKWVSKIEDFKPPMIESVFNGGYEGISIDDMRECDVIVSNESIPNSTEHLIQFIRRDKSLLNKSDFKISIFSYIFDYKDGSGYFLSDKLPIVRSISNSNMVTSVLYPYPTLNFYTY